MPTINGKLTSAERREVQNWLDNKVVCVCGQRMEPHPTSPIFDRDTYAEPYLPVRSVMVVCKSCARVQALDADVMGISLTDIVPIRPPLPSPKAIPSSDRAAAGGEADH